MEVMEGGGEELLMESEVGLVKIVVLVKTK